MYGKDGLEAERAHVERYFADTGQFALLHDLTNCLRIADVTELHTDGHAMIVEVKTSDRQRSEQTQRAQKAIDAIANGGPLPGSIAARFLRVSTPMVVQHRHLRDALDMAASRGVAGLRLPPGRALVAMDLIKTHDKLVSHDLTEGAALWDQVRAATIRRARIETATHHLRGLSFDTASRSPVQPPFTIYNLDPGTVARLVCDYTGFETVISADALAQICRDEGLRAEVGLRPAHGNLRDDDVVLRIQHRDLRMLAHPSTLSGLLYELLDPATWARALRETVESAHRRPGAEPLPLFSDESKIWA